MTDRQTQTDTDRGPWLVPGCIASRGNKTGLNITNIILICMQIAFGDSVVLNSRYYSWQYGNCAALRCSQGLESGVLHNPTKTIMLSINSKT